MRLIRSKLNYANVMATVAVFLALGGGAVYAASKIRSSDLAKNAVKRPDLAPNSIDNADFRKKSLITKSATGGGQTVNVAATPPASGFPLPLSGQTTFTPKKGYIGLLMVEARATLASAAPPANCAVFVTIFVNGEPRTGLFLSDVPFASATGDSTGAPFEDSDSASVPIGLTGGSQSITAEFDGDPNCAPTSTINAVRVVVQQSR